MTNRIEERGPWLQTLSGNMWFPYSPRAEEVVTPDIEALSRICRFGGHSTVFYSVAEHCVRVARAMEAAGHPREAVFCGLIHDAHEAYPPGDVPAPCRALWHEGSVGSAFASAAKELEKLAARAVREALIGADSWSKFAEPVKHFDLVLLATERRDLMRPSAVEWGALPAPLPERIEPWDCDRAWKEWRRVYVDLRTDGVPYAPVFRKAVSR